jgi:hypothetical protein
LSQFKRVFKQTTGCESLPFNIGKSNAKIEQNNSKEAEDAKGDVAAVLKKCME